MSKLTVVAEPGKHEVIISRVFDAPRELVYRTYTDPAAVSKWWGPRGVETIVEKMDVQFGGTWRFTHRAPGAEYSFRGVYHEVVPNERLVHTFEFEPMYGHIMLETITFEDQDGKTLVTDKSVFQTVADRDGMIQSGMERGMDESFTRFEELLAQA